MNPFRDRMPTRLTTADRNGRGERTATAGAEDHADEGRPGLVLPRPGPKRLLWEVLVELGFVDEQRVLEAEAVARAARQDLGAVLLERGLVSPEQLARAVAQREGLAFVDLDVFEVEEEAASLITPAVAERYGAILIGFSSSGEVLLALSNPRDRHAINDITMMVEPSVTRVVATRDDIEALIRRRDEAGADDDAEGSERGLPVAAGPSAPEEDPVDALEPWPGADDAPELVAVPDEPVRVAEIASSGVDARPDLELLDSLARGMVELETLVRGSLSDSDDERAAALAEAERQASELRTELETERAERAESERRLHEELETERATREALASDLAAVRTARDDLARRVASARDLLEMGARPHVSLHGREH